MRQPNTRVGYRIFSAIAAIEHGELSEATDHLQFAQGLMAEAFAASHAPAIAQDLDGLLESFYWHPNEIRIRRHVVVVGH